MIYRRMKQTALTLLSAVFLSHTPLFAEETDMSDAPTLPHVFENTHEHLLDNGLKVIVREDHRAPVVTTMVWYKVGSVDEPRGLGGISHMLEHMMFKGTPTLKANEHSTIIANLGGRDNAFTSYDYTAYFEMLPAWELETALRLESDRMVNLELRPEDFIPERQVVAEERRQRTDSNPQGQFYEFFNATMWNTSAYRNPIIGWMPEIERWKLSDLEEWYRRFYAPNNATLVIVGDVKAEEAFKLAEKYFGAIEPSKNIEHAHDFEVPQLGLKRAELITEVNMPLLFMGYKVPSINSAEDRTDVYALMLAAEILDGSRSSRLSRKLVRGKQSALQASAYYSGDRRFEGSFLLSAVPAINHDLATIEAQLLAQIERLKEEPVSKKELKRVLTRYRAESIYERDSLYYQAMEIGAAETTGEGWRHRETILDELEKITPEMIQAAVKRHLTTENLTIATLQSPSKNRVEDASPTKEQHGE